MTVTGPHPPSQNTTFFEKTEYDIDVAFFPPEEGETVFDTYILTAINDSYFVEFHHYVNQSADDDVPIIIKASGLVPGTAYALRAYTAVDNGTVRSTPIYLGNETTCEY